MRPPWLTLTGWLIAAIPLAFTFGMMTGCPKPVPPPVTPDAADASPAPPVPSCRTTCDHVELDLGCATGGSCYPTCVRVKRLAWRTCAAAAASCAAVDACGQ